MTKLGNIGIHIGARRKISLALMAAFGTLSLGVHAEGVATNHVHAEIRGGQAQMVGTPAATQVMNLDIVLPVRDRAGLQALAAQITDPDSPMFRKYITPAEFKDYLRRTDKAKLDAIISAKEGAAEVDSSVIGADEVGKWTAWWKMIDKPEKGARYTRLQFEETMKPGEFDRMLENVGAQDSANRQQGGAGGWYAANIPSAANTPLRPKDKPPLVRAASDPDLSKTWPKQLPEDVPRRFLRTWVRAVPKSTAAALRKL